MFGQSCVRINHHNSSNPRIRHSEGSSVSMAQAFYPTKDGHIGNLKTMSVPQLVELLTRQEKILQKTAFVNKLPDKGEKIRHFTTQLKQELQSRSSHSSGANDQPDKIHSRTTADGDNHSVLVEDFQRLTVGSTSDGEGNPKHYFEIAEERAEQNMDSGTLKAPIKLNRALKVVNVKDLPEEVTAQIPLKHTLPHPHNSGNPSEAVIEESAVCPPSYQFDTAQVISLGESIQLQQNQKQKQEELRVHMTTERLLQSRHIRMEEYNPEGIDMSYRDGMGGFGEQDADGAEASGSGHTMPDMVSDSDD